MVATPAKKPDATSEEVIPAEANPADLKVDAETGVAKAPESAPPSSSSSKAPPKLASVAAGVSTSPKPAAKGKLHLGSVGSAATAMKGAMRFAGSNKVVNEGPITKLVSAKVWDIYTLPPANTIKGKLVPRMMNQYAHRRKISLEVHRVTHPIAAPDETEAKKVDKAKKDEKSEEDAKKAAEQEQIDEHSYEECVIRVLVPATKEIEKAAQKAGADIRKGVKPEQAKLIQQASVRGASNGDEDFLMDDESTLVGSGADDLVGVMADTGGKSFAGWKAKYRVPIGSIAIKHQQKKSIVILLDSGKLRQERELLFDSFGEAHSFVQELDNQRKLEEDRVDGRLRGAMGELQLQPNETLDLLVEVVSGWDLPIGDLTTSDPYVVCKLDRRELHKTKHISGTLDPIWTIKTGSLFMCRITTKELFLSEGMTFYVKDYDTLGKNETLGICVLPAKRVYSADGERIELKVKNPPGHRGEDVPGYLAFRIRRANDNDKRFMEGYKVSEKSALVPSQPKSKNNAIKSMVTRYHKTDKAGVKRYKVRPKPDPRNTEPIEWMTPEEIETETMKPSREWIDAGSGNLGQLHVEVLGCDELPNLDAGGFAGNKTDAFVSLVFEDCYVRTDVLDDCLSPRWLPWTQRAFIFQIYHSSSQLLLGVFDFDAGIDDHDLIGRVSVDVASLQRNTEYILTYNIYPSARVTGREAQGTVTLRVRLEMDDGRKVLLSTLEPPPPIYVNTTKKKEYRVIRRTCLGQTDVDLYSIKTIKSYVDELREYQYIVFFLQDAAMTLLLWRGHYELKLGSSTYMVPVHSMVAFLLAIFLVENPQLVPSFTFASIAWLLLAVIGWKNNSKNVWTRTKTYTELAEALVLGNSSTKPHDYKPFHQYDEAKTEMEVWIQRIKDSEKASAEAYIEAQQAEEERLKELEEIGDENTDISTSTVGGISLDPIKAALFPVQQILGVVLRKLRFVKNITTWEECYFSFWIVTGCMILSFACLFVPWFFLLKWTSRLVAWVVFGPWMKLADVYYVSKIKPESEGEKKERKTAEKIKRKLATTKAVSLAREKREDAAKLKQMKKYMFGKFSMRIPILKEDRYVDRPLPQSAASPYQAKALSLAELAMQEAGYNRVRLPGQNLVGHMIPVAETQGFTAAPVGKATAKPEQLSKKSPGSDQKKGADSTSVVYAKIGSAVAVAGTVTWFAVPVLAGLAEKAIEVIS